MNNVRNQKQRYIMGLLCDRPIVFSPKLARITGSVNSGLFLSQLLYWQDKGKDKVWIYKTIKEFEMETTLKRKSQDTAIAKLKALKIIEVERRGNPGKRHFKINWTKFTALLDKEIEK